MVPPAFAVLQKSFCVQALECAVTGARVPLTTFVVATEVVTTFGPCKGGGAKGISPVGWPSRTNRWLSEQFDGYLSSRNLIGRDYTLPGGGVKHAYEPSHGFTKVRVSGFLYTDFADPTDFFRFSQRVRVVRAIRVQKLVFVKR